MVVSSKDEPEKEMSTFTSPVKTEHVKQESPEVLAIRLERLKLLETPTQNSQ